LNLPRTANYTIRIYRFCNAIPIFLQKSVKHSI
jgi:hypothetical protein